MKIAAFFKRLFGRSRSAKAEVEQPPEVCRAREKGGEWIDIDPDSVHCALMNGYEVQWNRWPAK